MKCRKRALLIALSGLLLLSAASCGGKKDEEVLPETEHVTGETMSNGTISMLVPDGWSGYECADIDDNYEGDTDPWALMAYKGSAADSDVASCPGLKVIFYEEGNRSAPDSDETVEKYSGQTILDDMTIGEKTFHAYSAIVNGQNEVVLWTEEKPRFEVIIYTDGSSGNISADDSDIAGIIQSVQTVEE